MKAFRVMEQGGSLRVTLPKEWTVENNIRAGDNMIVTSSGKVVIFCKTTNMNTEEQNSVLKDIETTLAVIGQLQMIGKWPPT